MNAVDPGGVRAAPLPPVLVDVDPAAPEAFPQHPDVLLAQRRQGRRRQLLGLLPRDANGHLGDDGRVDVVHVVLVQPEGPLPEGHVPVEGGQPLADGLDQVGVDTDGDVAGEEGRLQSGPEAAGPGEEDVLLDLGGQGRGQGVPLLLVGGVEPLEGLPADPAVPAFHQLEKPGVGDLHLPPRLVADGGEADVRLVDHLEDLGGALAHLARHGQEPFLGLGEGVGPAPLDLIQGMAVPFQAGRLLKEALQLLRRNGQDLRRRKGDRALQADQEVQGPGLAALALGVGGVLIQAHVRVAPKGLGPLAHLVVQLEEGQELLARLAQGAPEGRQLVDQAFQLVKGRLPRLIVGEDVFQAPAVLFGNAGPVGHLHGGLGPGGAFGGPLERILCHRLHSPWCLDAPRTPATGRRRR